MINKIYWDIDETLIHTMMRPPEQKHISFSLEDGMYYTIIRPCSKELIEFSREMVGAENVHILTSATYDYAMEINRQADWGFKAEDIFAREDMNKHTLSRPTIYSSSMYEVNPHIYAHKNNVLIDNLPPRQNDIKTSFIGINPVTNYLKIHDYYGVNNLGEDDFVKQVKEFLHEVQSRD
jgi:hypothetical protein